jgi:hypothetical protein
MVDEDPLPTEVFWFRTPVGQYIRTTYHREVTYRTGNLEAATYLADTAQLQLVPSPPETAHWVEGAESWRVVVPELTPRSR